MTEVVLIDQCDVIGRPMPPREDGMSRLAVDLRFTTTSLAGPSPPWPLFRLTDQMAMDLLQALASTLRHRVVRDDGALN
jgi:hypothetical protein